MLAEGMAAEFAVIFEGAGAVASIGDVFGGFALGLEHAVIIIRTNIASIPI